MKNVALALMTGLVLTACTAGEQQQTSADTAAAPAASPSPAAGSAGATGASTVTDPQIAAIVVAANNADIEGGRLAASKSTNAKVKEFAQRMITDHTGVNKAATDLVTKLGVTPEESPASRQQTQAGQQSRSTLQAMSGAEFDRAYIANEVTYHQGLLDAIDNTLIPSAQNAELKALLQQTRPAVVAHLKHAQELQASLGKS